MSTVVGDGRARNRLKLQGRARSGIAPGLEPGVRRFESCCPDMTNTLVTPDRDTQPHYLKGDLCPCNPEVEVMENGNTMTIHNLFGNRETTWSTFTYDIDDPPKAIQENSVWDKHEYKL
jgi:hypothetical protein